VALSSLRQIELHCPLRWTLDVAVHDDRQVERLGSQSDYSGRGAMETEMAGPKMSGSSTVPGPFTRLTELNDLRYLEGHTVKSEA